MNKKKYLIPIFLLIILTLAFPVNALSVTVDNNTKEYTAIWGNKTIKVDYIHSVQRSKCIEIIEANNKRLQLKRKYYKDFGAGLPTFFDEKEDGYYIKYYERDLGTSFEYFFIPLNEVKIKIDGNTIYKNPEERIEVRFNVEKASLIKTLMK